MTLLTLGGMTLLTLESPSDFAVVDRIDDGHDCDVFEFDESIQISK